MSDLYQRVSDRLDRLDYAREHAWDITGASRGDSSYTADAARVAADRRVLTRHRPILKPGGWIDCRECGQVGHDGEPEHGLGYCDDFADLMARVGVEP